MKASLDDHNNLDFYLIYEEALNDWPSEVDLTEIEYSDMSSSRYSVSGLGLLAEEIGENYIGTSKEVLMRNIHDSIFDVIHNVARFCNRLRLRDLRKETVKTIFEDRLKDALNMEDLGWEKVDKDLIRRYFALIG